MPTLDNYTNGDPAITALLRVPLFREMALGWSPEQFRFVVSTLQAQAPGPLECLRMLLGGFVAECDASLHNFRLTRHNQGQVFRLQADGFTFDVRTTAIGGSR